jgi:hypothetical protein
VTSVPAGLRAPAFVRARAASARALLISVRTPLLCFAASRVLVLGTALTWSLHSGRDLLASLATWDGTWYLTIATQGYPSSLPMHEGLLEQSRLAFFPLYPALVRAVGLLLGLPALPAALLVSFVAGALSACVLWRLALSVMEEKMARRAVVLYCFFPGSAALSMVYPEAMFLALSFGSLLALQRSRWGWAGALAGLATATRSQGIVLVLACAWAAVHAFEEHGWKAVVPVAIAPTGMLAFFGFLWWTTGSPLTWFTAVEAWDMHGHGGLGSGLWNPLTMLVESERWGGMGLFGVAGLGMVLIWLVALARRPVIPVPLALFALGQLPLTFLTTGIGPQPRYLLLSAGLFLPVAMWWPEDAYRRRARFMGALLAVVTFMYVSRRGVFP